MSRGSQSTPQEQEEQEEQFEREFEAWCNKLGRRYADFNRSDFLASRRRERDAKRKRDAYALYGRRLLARQAARHGDGVAATERLKTTTGLQLGGRFAVADLQHRPGRSRATPSDAFA